MKLEHIRLLELEWYKSHGKYPERIAKDDEGLEYVIGDQSWRSNYWDKPEWIEQEMHRDIGI